MLLFWIIQAGQPARLIKFHPGARVMPHNLLAKNDIPRGRPRPPKSYRLQTTSNFALC